MLPWVRKFWEELSPEDKEEVSQQSVIICKHIQDRYVRNTAVDVARKLSSKFPKLGDDVNRALDAIEDCSDGVQPLSDTKFIVNYFQQLAAKAKKVTTWATPKPAPKEGGRRFLVNNGFHGQIAVNLLKEDDKNYFFEYVKDGEVVFTDWKLKKNSPRVIREL